MAAADTGPTSTQYQLAPASRKSGAALVFVPAVIEISSPAVLDAKPPGSLPGEVRVGVAAVQYEHPTGDQPRPDDTGDTTDHREHRRPAHGEQPGPDVDDGGCAAAGQHSP